jgi:hypothetical protein
MAASRLLAPALVLAACGRLGYEPRGGTASDASDATPIDWSTPFASPEPALVTAAADQDEDPALTSDLLELYFSATLDGNSDLWIARRAAPDAAWEPPQPVAELNTAAAEETPEPTADRLTLLFSSDRAGSLDVWMSSRASLTSPWSAPVAVAELNSARIDSGAQAVATVGPLLLASNRTGGAGKMDLYQAARPAGSTGWEVPVALAELNTAAEEDDPSLSGDGLYLVFASDRDGISEDLYLAARPALDQPFGTPVPRAALNTAGEEEDPWLSADGRILYFARDGVLWWARR